MGFLLSRQPAIYVGIVPKERLPAYGHARGEVGSRRIAFKQGSLFYPDSVGHLLRGSLNAFQAA